MYMGAAVEWLRWVLRSVTAYRRLCASYAGAGNPEAGCQGRVVFRGTAAGGGDLGPPGAFGGVFAAGGGNSWPPATGAGCGCLCR